MSSDTREPGTRESLLSRWSRRKHEAADAAALEQEQGQAQAADAPASAAAESAELPPALTDADMPDLDTLDENSDFSPFMSPGVSEELRNIALRKLFHTPAFNIRDGLDEYDDDYTSFEKLGNIVTADMKHQAEMQRQKLREALQREQQDEAARVAQADAEDALDDEEAAQSDERGPEDVETAAEDGPQDETEPRHG